jgi:hypothetical protein
MDTFREKQNEQCGPGGLHCQCCNPHRNCKTTNHKPKLNRIARRKVKVETENIIKEEGV